MYFPEGGVFGAPAETLNSGDAGSLSGALRLAAKGIQPECTEATR